MPATKIATCCYCGTRAALRLRGKQRHELACGSCGAPLRDLKMLPVPERVTAPAATPTHPAPRRPAPRRKLGRLASKLWDEVWDEIEDIFD